MRQDVRNTLGGERLLDNTDFLPPSRRALDGRKRAFKKRTRACRNARF